MGKIFKVIQEKKLLYFKIKLNELRNTV